MTDPTPVPACRSCGARDLEPIIDLGPQPDPDRLLDPLGDDHAPEAPISLAICATCGLVQLVGPRPGGPRSPHGHTGPAIGPADPWFQRLVQGLAGRDSVVVEIDGSASSAASAVAGLDRPVLALPEAADGTAGVVLVGHALAHADDLGAILAPIGPALAPLGRVAIDFHHVLGVANGQFDVLSHAHRSYLSLHSLEAALRRHDLAVLAAEPTNEYGGSVRVIAGRSGEADVAASDATAIDRIRAVERAARIEQRVAFEGLAGQVRRACDDLRDHLDQVIRSGRTVAGYGAAARGTTLLNFAGIGLDRLPFTVDRSPVKQDRLLPRSRIPVLPPAEIERIRPDDLLVLPWTLASEIADQLAHARSWGARFFVAMPELRVLP